MSTRLTVRLPLSSREAIIHPAKRFFSTFILHLSTFILFFILIACSQAVTSAPEAESTQTPAYTPIPLPAGEIENVIILSMEENGYAHLFAYSPGKLPLTRLTTGDWNDVTPALSPDGARIAFASDRNGFWDIYLLELSTGDIRHFTDTPAYDSSPTWSPDLAWIAFETYENDNLEIAIKSLTDSTQEAILLTNDPAADHSPVWAPNGRQIAFVSSRTGDADIWLADLDITDATRFKNLSSTPQAEESHPAYSFDGAQLLWTSVYQSIGYNGIYLWDTSDLTRPSHWIGDGNWAAWNGRGDRIIAVINGPNQQYLTSYTTDGKLILPPEPLKGHVRGLLWPHATMTGSSLQIFGGAAIFTPAPLWAPAITPASDVPNKRWYVVELPNVQAPYPKLHDLVDESFSALRQRIIVDAGWDALAGLENAFVPLTTSLDPGFNEDWLYTGRAFAVNSTLANAGWLATVREDIGAQTYWRLYIRALQQDGSQGEPLHSPPWDLNARYNLNPRNYEQGGGYASVPTGYWVDVSALAAAYNWERLPALPNWRTYYAGTRFTEFALTGGLDWYSAMLELYPAQVLATPTRVLAPSATPSKTLVPTETLAPTRTRGPSPTPTNTFTPLPPTATFTPPPPTSTPPTIIP
jgi:TolB protein